MTTVAELQASLSQKSPEAEVVFESHVARLDQTHLPCGGTGFIGEERDPDCLGTGLVASSAAMDKAASYVVLTDVVTAPAVVNGS
jgi:hypothetical protein